MMRFDIITIFPGVFESVFSETILKKAVDKGLVTITVHDLRDHAEGKHRVTDDIPFGGGPGMVMKPEPIFRAVEDVRGRFGEGKVILLSPSGKLFDSKMAKDLAGEGHLILICGRYEGVDQRVANHLADQEVSVGDYVLTGGEIPAMVVVDSVSRFVPGVVGRMESVKSDSFEGGFLEGPHYTRPQMFRGMKVPGVLLSGDHGKIGDFRLKEAIRKTLRARPGLIDMERLNDREKHMVTEVGEEEKGEGK